MRGCDPGPWGPDGGATQIAIGVLIMVGMPLAIGGMVALVLWAIHRWDR